MGAEHLDGRQRRERQVRATASTTFAGPTAHVKFLSIEPLIGPVGKLNLRAIDWVIVGGESGPHARAMDPCWVTGLRDQCRRADVPFFFKQWGGVQKKKTGRTLEGRTWDEMPAVAELVSL